MREYKTNKPNSWVKKDIKAKDIPKEEFVKACLEAKSMAHAASILGLQYVTFKKYAKQHDCYLPKPGAKGCSRDKKPLLEIDDYTSRSGFKRRIIQDNLLPYICSICKLDSWLGKTISLHLDHINGIGSDNRLENVRFLCPNCHSQTDTYCGNNK